MAGYYQGFKNLLGAICGGAVGVGVAGKELTKKLGKKGSEILYYLCGAGFVGLGLLTRRGGNPPPSQVAPPPPGHEAPRPKPPRTKNVRPERRGNRYMRRPGANRPGAPAGFIYVTSRGRVVQISSPSSENNQIKNLSKEEIDFFVHKYKQQ